MGATFDDLARKLWPANAESHLSDVDVEAIRRLWKPAERSSK
jgi:hypothetical protein